HDALPFWSPARTARACARDSASCPHPRNRGSSGTWSQVDLGRTVIPPPAYPTYGACTNRIPGDGASPANTPLVAASDSRYTSRCGTAHPAPLNTASTAAPMPSHPTSASATTSTSPVASARPAATAAALHHAPPPGCSATTTCQPVSSHRGSTQDSAASRCGQPGLQGRITETRPRASTSATPHSGPTLRPGSTLAWTRPPTPQGRVADATLVPSR